MKDLVEQMLAAYSKVHYGCSRPTDGYNSAAMTAAAKVCLDARDEQWTKAFHAHMQTHGSFDENARAYCLSQIKLILSRLLAPKTAEERVTIQGVDACWHVYLDGRWQESFSSERKAGIYRRGLIAEIKEREG